MDGLRGVTQGQAGSRALLSLLIPAWMLNLFESDAAVGSERFRQCCEAVSVAVAGVTNLDHLAECVYQTLLPFYAVNASRRDPVWRDPAVRASVHATWKIWRELMRRPGLGLRALMKRWLLVARLRHFRRQQHQLSKQKRKERLERLHQRAAVAAQHGNQRELHKIVRLLSPKAPRRSSSTTW